jgi:hypothetical protein
MPDRRGGKTRNYLAAMLDLHRGVHFHESEAVFDGLYPGRNRSPRFKQGHKPLRRKAVLWPLFEKEDGL